MSIIKGIGITIICVTMLFFTSCIYKEGVYSGQRPASSRYPNTVWVSEDPDIWFKVAGSDEQDNGIFGKLVTDETEYNIEIEFDAGNGIDILDIGDDVESAFFNSSDDVILTGNCKFSSEKMVVSLDKNKVLDPVVRKITFICKRAGDKSVQEMVNINSVAVLEFSTTFKEAQVKGDKIYFYFSVALRNNGKKDKRVRLKKYFYGIDVLKEYSLESVTEDGEEEIFEVKAGSTVTYPVIFIGSYTVGDYESLDVDKNMIVIEVE
jgi:hypothetical protein